VASSKLRAWVRLLAPVLASLLGLAALRLLGPDLLDQQRLRSLLAPLGVLAPLAFIGLLAVRPLALLPGQLFAAVGGMLFGVVWGSAYALLGSVLSTAVLFFLSKRFGTRWMRRFAGGQRYTALARTARRHGFKVAWTVCINPLVPTDVLVALAGASGARFWPTAVGVLLGSVPGTVLTAQFGSALSQGRLVMTVLAGVGLIVSMVVGVFVGRRVVSDYQQERRGARRADEATQARVGA
jgi:uncharacterized membrane protein YdjX (TVP38/TMEM64 family)